MFIFIFLVSNKRLNKNLYFYPFYYITISLNDNNKRKKDEIYIIQKSFILNVDEYVIEMMGALKNLFHK